METKPTRVLLVDGDRHAAEGISDCFQQRGVDLEVAEDGPRGLAKALIGGYDVVMIDIVLRGFDGFSLLESLRRQSRVPAILFSAPLKHSHPQHGLHGADSYMPKPFQPAELYEQAVRIFAQAHATHA